MAQDELIVSTVNLAGGHTAEEVHQAQLSDECVGKILQAKEIDERPISEFSRGQSPNYRRLHQQWGQLTVQEGVLEALPYTIRNPKLATSSCSTNPTTNNFERLARRCSRRSFWPRQDASKLKERFYWPGHFNAMQDWCQACPECATRKLQTPRRCAPLGTITARYSTQIMAVDLLGPLPESSNGNSYVMVVVIILQDGWRPYLFLIRRQRQ